MKHLLFLFAALFAVSACDGPNNFASIADKPPEGSQAQSQGKPQRKIQKILEGETKEKVGGKDRKTINIPKTAGEKDLGKKKSITNISVESAIVRGEPEKKKVVKEIKEKVVEKVGVVKRIVRKMLGREKPASPEKKLDILFYMENRDTKCIKNIISYSEEKGFLKHLNHLDWQVSFSYYTQVRKNFSDAEISTELESAMLELEYNNGQALNEPWAKGNRQWKFEPDYVLSKGEYTPEQADRIFNTTLTAYYGPEIGPDETYSSLIHDHNLNTRVYHAASDPLSGLDALLSKKYKGSVRSDSHVVALFFHYSHYYSKASWKRFFDKHKNVSLIFVERPRVIFNYNSRDRVRSNNYDFEWVPGCDNDNDDESPAQLIQAIKSKVQ